MLITTTSKKSQVEIIGLVIIVILIALAMLFVLQFSLKTPVSIKKSYTHEKIAEGELNTLLRSATDCKQNAVITVSDLLKECVEAGDYAEMCDYGGNYCDWLDVVVDEILNETLIAWNKDFELTAVVGYGANKQVILNKTNPYYYGRRDYTGVDSTPPWVIQTFAGMVRMSIAIYG